MNTQTIHILLIEDNPGDVRLIAELLKDVEHFPFELHSENRLSAGLDYLLKGTADIILLDLSLPDSQGFDTFAKTIACAAQTPIVILTGLADDALAIKAVQTGVQDYLVKGQVNGDLLVRTIRYAIERKQAEEALQRSEKKFKAIVESSLIGVFSTNLKGEVLYVNEALVKMLEFDSPAELIDSGAIARYSNPEDRNRLLNILKNKGRVESFDVSLLTKKGEIRNVLLNVTLDGEVITGMALDITDRKQAEQALAGSENKFKWLYEYAPIAYHILTPKGLIMDVNRRWCQVLGYPKEEVLGKEIFDFIVEEERKAARASFIKKKADKRTFIEGRERNYLTKAGVVRTFKTHDFLVVDQSQNITSVQTTLEDITERKQAEQSLLIMSDTQRRLSQLDNLNNVYQLVGSKIQKLTKGSYVVVTELDEKIQATRMKEMFGFGKTYQNLVHLFKVDPAHFVYYLKDMTVEQLRSFRSGKLEKIKGGLYQMLIHKVPEPICKAAEKKLNCEGIYTIGFVWQGLHFGALTILARSDITSFKKTIEIIMQQASITINRIKTGLALQESEKRYRSLFEDSPISLWEEDLSAVKQRLDALRAKGITDLRAYLESHPQEVADCAALVRVLDVNKATVELNRAKSKGDLINKLAQVMGVESHIHFIDELVSIAEGQTQFSCEGVNQTLTGEQIDINLSLSVVPGHESDLSKVLVSIVDITQRKQAEKEMRLLINDLRNLSEVEKKHRLFAEALAENIISIKSTLNTDEILDSIIDNINNVVPSDAISIMLIQDHHARIVRAKGYQERGLTDWVKQRQFNLDEIKSLKEIIQSKKYKITSNTDKSQDWTAIAETAWIKSNIISPILDNETVIGFVNVDSTTPDFYTEEHAQHLTVFTDQVSTALKNARLYEATQRRMNHMQAMTQIDQAINSSLDLNVSLEIVLSNAKEQLSADAVDILLVNDATNSLVFSKAKGFKTDEIRKSNLTLGSGLTGRAVLERTTVAIPDLKTEAESYFKNLLIEREGFISYYCVPLITKGELKGVMEVYFRQAFQADQEWLEFLEMLAQQTAIAINNAELWNSLQTSNIELLSAYETTLKGWVDALDMRDKETEGHTQRVTELSLKLAKRMGIKEREIVNFQRGALLHDIGKVAIPDAILNKPGPLTDEEWVIMRKHPLHAYSLLSKSKYLEPAMDIPFHHHEKWDGSGYPSGLKGEAIPLAARIFAIVDVWDALISDRPYRKAWTKKKALKYIQKQSGKHFDPEVVKVFLKNPSAQNMGDF